MGKWFLKSINVNGGFLQGFSLELPQGLTCIIGPRGSGKSTLMEAFRFGISGTTGAPKSRLDLIQANFGTATLITIETNSESDSPSYTIRRTHKQPASLLTADGKSITTVDLDRGTFLPLDAYSSTEIESIADESVGAKRRTLLDELRGDELQVIHLAIAEHRRSLDGNADRIRAARRLINDLTEQIEELGDVRARLVALPNLLNADASINLVKATKQQQINQREERNIEVINQSLVQYKLNLRKVLQQRDNKFLESLPIETSENIQLLERVRSELTFFYNEVENDVLQIVEKISQYEKAFSEKQNEIKSAHTTLEAKLNYLREQNLAASQAIQTRTLLEQRVGHLSELETNRNNARLELENLLEKRKSLKATYLLERDQISRLREDVAAKLQSEAGHKVRIRVNKNADNLNYQQMLIEGLRGARVRNQEDIIDTLMGIRPEQLAQIIQANDLGEFESLTDFGTERSRKILESFREHIDPLNLEVVPIEDRILIELNVATGAEANFKDAAELSRGQKCTALLPLLLARRATPLLIDQPEDNLDNHFIYETVVETIQRLKGQRQMVFITHNANIPVLAEADLIVVLNSDGKNGYIEKMGTLDECRDEIIDLLEGGSEAFELRRKRYAKR